MKISFIGKIVIILFFAVAINTGCHDSEKPSFNREKELFSYLSDIHGLELDEFQDETALFLMQLDMCGACTERNKQFVHKLLSKRKGLKKIVVLSRKDIYMTDFLKSSSEDVVILTDKNFSINKYGLRFTKDIFVLIANQKVNMFSFLTPKTIPDLTISFL